LYQSAGTLGTADCVATGVEPDADAGVGEMNVLGLAGVLVAAQPTESLVGVG